MSRTRALRLIAGYGAIASALPYLALKIVWLSGGSLGATDPTLMRDTSMIALNLATAGMDLVGVALALAFTHQWGQRIPAWLLLPPMWVATGLLARFIIGVPIVVAAGALAPASVPRAVAGPVQPWVYAVVYTEFAGMGIGLIAAFVLYAKARWAGTLDAPAAGAPLGATHELQVVLANTTVIGAIALTVAALAATADAVARRALVGTALNGIDVGMTMAAAGVLMMVHRIGNTPLFWPLAMAWTGAGSLFSWGLWQSINVMGRTALMRGAEAPPLVNLVGLLRLITGLVMGLLIVFLLAERTTHRR